jgi:hypothetical protein
MIFSYLILASLILAAPQTLPRQPQQPNLKGTSTSSNFQETVGQRLGPGYVSKAYFPSTTRFLYPDSLIPKDFSNNRLNVKVDANSVIISVYYG